MNEIEETLEHRVKVQTMLWSLPLISNTDVPVALGISQAQWQIMKAEGAVPPSVWIGRRRFYRSRDVRQWIDEQQAKKNPGDEAGVQVMRAV